MHKKHPDNGDTNELSTYRQQIDALDDQLIALLEERIAIVGKVGEFKRKYHPGQCPLRPGREAQMVRRIIEKCQKGAFPPSAAAAMWRILIGASTALEAPLKLAVYTPDNDSSLYWMAREYFGPSVPVNRHPHVKRVIGDIMDNKASVGIVPMLQSADTSYWWTNLLQGGNSTPKIFAHVPFAHYGAPVRDTPTGLAIGCIEPEETGDDMTLLVLEADHNASQNRLQVAFSEAMLEPNWISVATISASVRHHLIEVKGFIPTSHEAIRKLRDTLGSSIANIHFLGAYAAPITV